MIDITLSLCLQAAATATTLISMWLLADKSLGGPVVGQVSNGFWLALEVHQELWGLMPLGVVMVFLHARIFIKWRAAR